MPTKVPVKKQPEKNAKPKGAYEYSKTVKEVHDVMSHMSEFVHGSDEEKLSIVINYALYMGLPYSTAFRIACRVLERHRRDRKLYI